MSSESDRVQFEAKEESRQLEGTRREKYLRAMVVGELTFNTSKGRELIVERVIGGWIYTTTTEVGGTQGTSYNDRRSQPTSTFVPEPITLLPYDGTNPN